MCCSNPPNTDSELNHDCPSLQLHAASAKHTAMKRKRASAPLLMAACRCCCHVPAITQAVAVRCACGGGVQPAGVMLGTTVLGLGCHMEGKPNRREEVRLSGAAATAAALVQCTARGCSCGGSTATYPPTPHFSTGPAGLNPLGCPSAAHPPWSAARAAAARCGMVGVPAAVCNKSCDGAEVMVSFM